MNKKIVFVLINVLSVFAYFAQSYAAWQTTINAKREDSQPYVTIGISDVPDSKSAPPEPPDFKCFMYIESTIDNAEKFKKNIQEQGKCNYQWVLAINPHGVGMPDPLACNLSWDPSQLGPGLFQLIEGKNLSGNVMISDMKKTSNIDITGENKYYHFSIVKKPDLANLIYIFRVLAGFDDTNTILCSDVIVNNKIELDDGILLLQKIAGMMP
jgi:hypothetical protein